MMKNFGKVLLASSLALAVIVPAFANTTDVSILATVSEVTVLQVERVVDNGIVSGDDLDPSIGSPTSNEIIDFGTVTALGQILAPGAASANGTDNTGVTGMVIDTAGMLYGSTSTVPATATREGAIFYLPNRLQLRQLRTGGTTSTMDVDVYNDSLSALDAIAEPASTTFAAGNSLAPNQVMKPGIANGRVPANAGGLVSALPRDTAYPITIGIHVPLTQASATNLKTTIIFTGT